MITVTRLNDSKLVINSDLIEFVESIPDTIISLTTGKKIIVKESTSNIIQLVAEFRNTICCIREDSSDTENISNGSN